MRSVLAQLLHDLCEVDRREKVAPAELGQHVDLLHVLRPVRQPRHPRHRAPRWRTREIVFRPQRLRIFGEVGEAVAEEAVERRRRHQHEDTRPPEGGRTCGLAIRSAP